MNKKEQKEAAENLFVAIETVTARVIEDRLEEVTERLDALEPEEGDEEELVTVETFEGEVASIKERLDSLEAGDDEEEEEEELPAAEIRDALVNSLQDAESFEDFRKEGLKLLQKL